ncbi:RNAse G [Kushneria sinocarnis]|uniref:Ribonuclease G n=1 Tax=Kushneria sinocarnis TaxID=595502 RepID=A0A420WVD9_9GAMM|nr:ribonuclease G [Kushneria sinocarnis]RKR02541.1 RNAse G [Kushneria sinocarnis]
MSGEILINMTPMETRVAVIESGVVQEAWIERQRRRGIVSNIYLGIVARVLPGMQAAFVDIGLERTAFIHAQEIMPPGTQHSEIVPISELLREGQALVVQVVKDPIGTKGARLTTQLSIPSRYLVYMPGASHTGVSQRIEGDAERERLRGLVERCREQHASNMAGGYIIRTAAEGAEGEALVSDMQFLLRLWQRIEQRRREQAAPALFYEDLCLASRTLRDTVRDDIERIRIDSRENFERLLQFARDFMPRVAPRIELYAGERPIFDLFSVEDELSKSLGRRTPLKSGGYLVIDQTEAMTTIDVNTGAFVGHRNFEETIFKTNLEAATAIARQLRLRNLGGIIIIDFIDMLDPEHQRQVLRVLEKALERDPARNKLSGVTELGLVQLTRKRTRESLEHVLCEPCPVCEGRGSLKTPETVCYEIFREIIREERAYAPDSYLVTASRQVVDRLLDEESTAVADLEAFIGKPIRFRVEHHYSQEQYDIVLM